MDGVVADFDGYTITHLGKTLSEFQKSQEGWDAIASISQDMYLKMEPMADADYLVSSVIALGKIYGFGVGVLTAIPKFNRVPLAEEHKRMWLKQYYPKLLTDFNIGPHAVDKQNHCKKGDILIDDNDKNIPQWRAKGGVGIFHTTAVNSVAELLKHLRGSNE